MNRFAGKNAIVTGASRGIGAALAERLAAEGANVVVVARTVDQHDHLTGSLSETLQRCRRHGAKVDAVAADLADPASRAGIVPRALEIFDGRIDILVNNAAAAIYMRTSEYPYKRQRIMFEVNVHAPIELAQAVLPSMVAQGGVDSQRLERERQACRGPTISYRRRRHFDRRLRCDEGGAQPHHERTGGRTLRNRRAREYG